MASRRRTFAFFGERIWQILTSCSERRLDEYERIGWWDFIGAEQRSDAYQKFFGIGFTRSLVAAQAKLASTKTIGDIFVQLFFNLAEPGHQRRPRAQRTDQRRLDRSLAHVPAQPRASTTT